MSGRPIKLTWTPFEDDRNIGFTARYNLYITVKVWKHKDSVSPNWFRGNWYGELYLNIYNRSMSHMWQHTQNKRICTEEEAKAGIIKEIGWIVNQDK